MLFRSTSLTYSLLCMSYLTFTNQTCIELLISNAVCDLKFVLVLLFGIILCRLWWNWDLIRDLAWPILVQTKSVPLRSVGSWLPIQQVSKGREWRPFMDSLWNLDDLLKLCIFGVNLYYSYLYFPYTVNRFARPYQGLYSVLYQLAKCKLAPIRVGQLEFLLLPSSIDNIAYCFSFGALVQNVLQRYWLHQHSTSLNL